MTDAESMKDLVALKKLRSLDLRKTKVTDAGVKTLAASKTLSFLTLSETKVTDTGVKALAAVKTPQIIDLVRNLQVTDDGIKGTQEGAYRTARSRSKKQ